MKKPIVFLGMLLLSMISEVDLKQTKNHKENTKHLQKLKKQASKNFLQDHLSPEKPKKLQEFKSKPQKSDEKDQDNKETKNKVKNSELNEKSHHKSKEEKHQNKKKQSSKSKDVSKQKNAIKKKSQNVEKKKDQKDKVEQKKDRKAIDKKDKKESQKSKRQNSNKKNKQSSYSEESDDQKQRHHKSDKLKKSKNQDDHDQKKNNQKKVSNKKDKVVKEEKNIGNQRKNKDQDSDNDQKQSPKNQKKHATKKQRKDDDNDHKDQSKNQKQNNKKDKQLKQKDDQKQNKSSRKAKNDKKLDNKNKKNNDQQDDIQTITLNPDDFKQLTKKLTIIDTRPAAQDGLIKGSYWFADESIIKKWIGVVLQKNSEYLLVTEKGKQKQTIKMFKQLGYKNIKGINGFDVKNFSGEKNVPAIKHKNELEPEKCFNLNVKSKKECKGVVQKKQRTPNSLVIPLQELEERVDELKDKENIVINCKDQNQAKVAYSILANKGIYCYVLSEGTQQLNGLGYTIVKY